MKYAYENLSPDQFERMIVLLCQQLLGISVQGFATGPDGGRDAQFHGTAELHPSKASPWVGITVIQAKHTNGLNRSFSETDFFNPRSTNTVIGKEVPRIKKLRANHQLDHYMLFSNRRLPANADAAIKAHISSSCKIPASSLYMCGVEQIEILLKTFNQVPKLAELDPIDSPLIVSSEDLAEIIQSLAQHKSALIAVLDNPPTQRTSYAAKNAINSMSDEYAQTLLKRYLKETAQIQAFLSAPENRDSLRLYESIVEEFQLRIVAKRKDYQSFDSVMEHLVDLLHGRDPILRQNAHKPLVRAMLFYMYWNCDIGRTVDAPAD